MWRKNMDRKVVLSISAIIVMGVLIGILNIFTQLPPEAQNNNQIQKLPENQASETDIEQKKQEPEEEIIHENQNTEPQDIILIN